MLHLWRRSQVTGHRRGKKKRKGWKQREGEGTREGRGERTIVGKREKGGERDNGRRKKGGERNNEKRRPTRGGKKGLVTSKEGEISAVMVKINIPLFEHGRRND